MTPVGRICGLRRSNPCRGRQYHCPMLRKYRLEPFSGGGAPLEFEWDPDTGQVRGPGADNVRECAAEAKVAGYTLGHPHPTPYKVSDPLRRPAELAVILGTCWKLPPDLQAAYPKPPIDNDIPKDAVA